MGTQGEETYVVRLKADAEQLKAVLREAGVSSVAELKGIGAEAKRARDETDRFVRDTAGGLDRVQREAKETSSVWRREMGEMRSALGGIASFARDGLVAAFRPIRTVLAPLAGIAATVLSVQSALATTREAADFQLGLAEISTIADEATFDLAKTRREILDLSVATGALPTATAKAFYETLSAGFTDAADASAVLAAGAKLGVAGLATTEQTVDLLTTTLNAYNLEVSESARLSDVFFAAVKVGKTTIPELASSIGQVLPLASALGVSIEDVAGAVAALTIRGVATPEAVTQLRALFKSLLTEGAALDAVMRRTGGSYDINAVRARGLAAVLNDLRGSVTDESEAITVLGGRIEATSALLGLSGDAAEGYQQSLEAVRASSGETSKALDKITGTDAFKVRQAFTALKAEALAFGDALLAAAARVIDDLGGVDTLQQRFRIFFEALGPTVTSVGESVSRALTRFELFGTDVELAQIKVEQLGASAGRIFSGMASAIEGVSSTLRTASDLLDALSGGGATSDFLRRAGQGDVPTDVRFGVDPTAGAPPEFREQLDALRDLRARAEDLRITEVERVVARGEAAQLELLIRDRAREILGIEQEQARAAAETAAATMQANHADRERLELLRAQLELRASGQLVGPPTSLAGGGTTEAPLAFPPLGGDVGGGTGLGSDPLTAAIDRRNALLAESTDELAQQAQFETTLLALQERQLAFMDDEVDRRELAIDLVETRARMEAEAIDLQVEAGKLAESQALQLKAILEGLTSEEIARIRADVAQAKTDLDSLGAKAGNIIERDTISAVGDYFAAWITGAEDAKFKFKEFADALLADLARLAAQQLVLAFFASIPGGGGTALAKGGVIPQGIGQPMPLKNYAAGGIADSPQFAVFGEGRQAEAFVPLPDNRRIPVKFDGQQGMGGSRPTINITFAPQLLDTRTLAERLPELAEDLARLIEARLHSDPGLRDAVRSTSG